MKRHIADALSLCNLTCGLTSMYFAWLGALELALLMLLVGALFDGVDGAASRRWGGTRLGVYADDVADAVNFAFAPGAALFFTLPESEGLVIGGLYTVFTLGRLVFFTVTKDSGDPRYFSGIPSTIGGIMVLCALILAPDHPVTIGVLVGAACAQMVSFASAYRHLGRAVAKHRRVVLALSPVFVSPFLLAAALFGSSGVVALLLVACLAYGLTPVFTAVRDRAVASHP